MPLYPPAPKIPAAPTLQQVTDVGNSTTDSISVGAFTANGEGSFDSGTILLGNPSSGPAGFGNATFLTGEGGFVTASGTHPATNYLYLNANGDSDTADLLLNNPDGSSGVTVIYESSGTFGTTSVNVQASGNPLNIFRLNLDPSGGIGVGSGSGSGTVIVNDRVLVRPDNSIRPAHLDDSVAISDSMYFSTTANQMAYKDQFGSVTYF